MTWDIISVNPNISVISGAIISKPQVLKTQRVSTAYMIPGGSEYFINKVGYSAPTSSLDFVFFRNDEPSALNLQNTLYQLQSYLALIVRNNPVESHTTLITNVIKPNIARGFYSYSGQCFRRKISVVLEFQVVDDIEVAQ